MNNDNISLLFYCFIIYRFINFIVLLYYYIVIINDYKQIYYYLVIIDYLSYY
jgi:hypothetical protein